jgi:integrase
MEKQADIRTSSAIDWEVLHKTIRKIEKDENYWLSSYIILSIYTALRVSDVKRITWCQVLSGKDYLDIVEKKTKKSRRIHLNPFLIDSIRKYKVKLNINDLNQPIVSNREGKSVSTIYLNRVLKKANYEYGMGVKNMSSHSLRKSFGMHVWKSNGCSDKVLTLLSEIFNHSKVSITRKYIGLVEEDIIDVYCSL